MFLHINDSSDFWYECGPHTILSFVMWILLVFPKVRVQALVLYYSFVSCVVALCMSLIRQGSWHVRIFTFNTLLLGHALVREPAMPVLVI